MPPEMPPRPKFLIIALGLILTYGAELPPSPTVHGAAQNDGTTNILTTLLVEVISIYKGLPSVDVLLVSMLSAMRI